MNTYQKIRSIVEEKFRRDIEAIVIGSAARPSEDLLDDGMPILANGELLTSASLRMIPDMNAMSRLRLRNKATEEAVQSYVRAYFELFPREDAVENVALWAKHILREVDPTIARVSISRGTS